MATRSTAVLSPSWYVIIVMQLSINLCSERELLPDGAMRLAFQVQKNCKLKFSTWIFLELFVAYYLLVGISQILWSFLQ